MELKHNRTEMQADKALEKQSIRDLLIWLGREMDYARSYCGPNQSITSETAGIWLAKWESLARKHGKARFHAALERALSKNKGFLPTPGIIEDELETEPESEPREWVKPVDWPQTPEQEQEQRGIHREFVQMVSQKFSGQSESKLGEVELQERKDFLKRQAAEKQGK